jgi:hypothetical protein
MLERIFERGDVFTPLARFLFRPLPSIRQRIQQFKEDNFGDYTIGLQIRRIGINKLNQSQEELFWEKAKELSAEKEGKRVKWFLATDHYDTRRRAMNYYSNRIIFQNASIARNSEQTIITGLVDMWLLSECDDIIVSAASTYGRISFGLRGKEPYYVNRNSECKRRDDWQPCFFQYKNHFCTTNQTISNYLWPQISECRNT